MLPRRAPRPNKGSPTKSMSVQADVNVVPPRDDLVPIQSPEHNQKANEAQQSHIPAPKSRSRNGVSPRNENTAKSEQNLPKKSQIPRKSTPNHEVINDFEAVLRQNIEEERQRYNENDQRTDRERTPLSQRRIQKKKVVYADSAVNPDENIISNKSGNSNDMESGGIDAPKIKNLEPSNFSYFDRLAYVDYTLPVEESK